jgi:hypothetical protein
MNADERILIEFHCQRLQTVYAVAADHGDIEGFVNCFAVDGEILMPGTPALRGHDAIRASIVQLGSLGVVYRHLITNCLVDVVDSNRATGLCYLLTFNSSASVSDGGSRPIEAPGTVGEYHDQFVKTKQGWRIQRRELKRVFRREDAVALAVAKLAPRA